MYNDNEILNQKLLKKKFKMYTFNEYKKNCPIALNSL